MKQMSARIVLVSFSFLFGVSLTFGQETRLPACLPEDFLPELKGLIDTALTQSPTTLSASLEVARFEASKMIDSSSMWPTLSADVRFGAVQSSIAGTVESRSRNTGLFYNLNLYQPLFHWGALRAQAQIGELSLEMSKRRHEDAYRLLVVSIRAQYLDLIQKKKAAQYASSTLKENEARVAALESRRAAGIISPAELNEPRFQLAESRIAFERLEDGFETSRRTLAAMCGVPQITAAQVADEFPQPVLSPEQLDFVLSLGKAFNPMDLPQGQLQEASLRQTELNYKIARTRTLPKFGMSAIASEQNNTDAANGRINQASISQQTIAISGSWLIFDGFAARGSKLSLLQQKRQQEQLIADFDRTQRDRADSLRKQVSFAARSLEIAETRFSIAKAGVVAVQDQVKAGTNSRESLDAANQAARTSELVTLAARTELFARLSEFLSQIGKDPAVLNLSYRNAK